MWLNDEIRSVSRNLGEVKRIAVHWTFLSCILAQIFWPLTPIISMQIFVFSIFCYTVVYSGITRYILPKRRSFALSIPSVVFSSLLPPSSVIQDDGSKSILRVCVFLNVEEGCSRATISSIPRHRVPPKDCSNLQHTWNSTEVGVLRSEKFRGCTCVDSAVSKSPQCFAHGPISKSLAEIALAYDAHLHTC